MAEAKVPNEISDLSSTGDILRKKMRPPTTVVGPCLAWWTSEIDRVMRNVCKTSLQMDVKLGALKGRQASAPAALDDMPKIALPFLLGTSETGAALFVLDGALIDGLIEQQLLGEVLPTERLDRPVTSIDAGLSQGFVHNALKGILSEASGQFAGLQVTRAEQDRANLRLALGEGHYDILEAEMDMGPGIKTGRFEIWLPALQQKKARSGRPRANPNMMGLMQSCEVELEARFDGCHATAHDLMNLDVGTILSVPRSALTQVEVTDCNGTPFAQARLGQLNGLRAVRLTQIYGKSALAPTEIVPPVTAPTTVTVADPAVPIGAPEPAVTFEDMSESKPVDNGDVESKALTG